MERKCKFTIDGKAFVANFPTVGQMIDMESLKQALTNNRYGTMAGSGIKSMFFALDMVDAVAFLQVVTPEVAKRFDIKNYIELPADKLQEYVKAYQEQIKPWYEGILKQLYGIEDGGTAEGEKNDETEG